MKRTALFSILAVLTASSMAYAEDPDDIIRQMQNELGLTAEMQLMNNGIKTNCNDSGTKKITVSVKGESTLYVGDYSKCQNGDQYRDGIYEIEVQGDEVISDSVTYSKGAELFEAANRDDLKKVKVLIRKNADPNYTSRKTTADGYIDNWTPLMSAVFNGNVNMVKQLLKAGAWVNFMNSRVTNAVWLAAGYGQLEIVKTLVAAGAYIDNRDSDDLTPLMAAAAYGHNDVVKYLIKSKAQLNLRHKEGDTALMFALASGRSQAAELLINAGANLNIQNKFGVTALMIAATENNVAMTKKLLDSKADTTLKYDGSKTALDIALFRGHTQIVDLLKKANAGQ